MTRSAATMDLAVVGCGAVVERLYRGALRALEARHIARVTALVDPDAARVATLRRHFPSAVHSLMAVTAHSMGAEPSYLPAASAGHANPRHAVTTHRATA